MFTTGIKGNLTKDPVTKQVNDKEVTNFTIAVNYTLGSSENPKEITRYLEVGLWGKPGEAAQRILKKGNIVLIRGGFVHTELNEKDDKTYLNERIVNPEGFDKISLD